MPQKRPECGSAKVTEIVCEFGLGAGLGQGGLRRVLHSPGSAPVACWSCDEWGEAAGLD